ncbi:MAG: DUF362 domain-containing protein [Nitrospirae bacterium]|nr:MAG: DUF362 domain-containing protein [Nitrospirota bacterium]
MINRREFMIAAAGSILTAATKSGEDFTSRLKGDILQKKAIVSMVKTSDRDSGIKRAIDLLKINPVRGKNVLLKPNFNTADPFPGSTHNDTLINLILSLRKMGAKTITIGERSGPPKTSNVLKEKGIYDICRIFDVGLINFEELPASDWIKIKPEKSHWRNGFDVAKPVIDSKCIVTTCCLKTHGYGGVFTMSLKLSVGITNKKNMAELHASPLMRKMIAEINQAYTPSLILLDGIEAFIDDGPAKGIKKRADVILAGTDRIAIDAIGLAILKELGSNPAIMETKIFEQEQIARAVELGLGVTHPSEIEIVTDSATGSKYAKKIMEILLRG